MIDRLTGKRCRAGLALAAFGVLGCCIAVRAMAQTVEASESHSRWWGDVALGVASLHTDAAPSGGDSRTGWVFDVAGGMRIGSHWLVGLELGGIGIEAYNLYDDTQGQSLGHVFAMAQYHAAMSTGWFAHIGAGWSSYTDNGFDGYLRQGDGWGAELGFGYEWRVAQWSLVTVLARYEMGHISLDNSGFGNDYDYRAPKLSVSWSFR